MTGNFLVLDAEMQIDVLKALASSARIRMLKLLQSEGGMNGNDIARMLELPQSTVSTNLQILEAAGLVRTETRKARKGNQKICFAIYDKVMVTLENGGAAENSNIIDVSMPLGLYTRCEVSAPCGLCSTTGVIGLLDVPGSFLDPGRMNAGLIWFTRGFVEYQFPNNAKVLGRNVEMIEFALELSSEVPGTLADWPSDITLSINGRDAGTWTSPGDFGDERGLYTPSWWKLAGSQYGRLKTWSISTDGTFIDGVKVSTVSIADLDLSNHHSIRLRIGVKETARHPGGINVFGRGFGNHDQDIQLRLHMA